MADKCACHLPLDPPARGEWWQPTMDDEPGKSVRAVIRFGDDPTLRRAVRRADGSGWCEHGAMVNFYHDLTVPMPWERTGRCWAGYAHPVTPCEP